LLVVSAALLLVVSAKVEVILSSDDFSMLADYLKSSAIFELTVDPVSMV
jgi:hypothetical protein